MGGHGGTAVAGGHGAGTVEKTKFLIQGQTALVAGIDFQLELRIAPTAGGRQQRITHDTTQTEAPAVLLDRDTQYRPMAIFCRREAGATPPAVTSWPSTKAASLTWRGWHSSAAR